MKFLGERLVTEVGIFVEEQFDAIAGLDVFEFLNFELVEKLQTFFLFLVDDDRDLRVIDERCQPELWDAFDDLVAFIVERSPQFVVFLFDLQDLLARLCENRIIFFTLFVWTCNRYY